MNPPPAAPNPLTNTSPQSSTGPADKQSPAKTNRGLIAGLLVGVLLLAIFSIYLSQHRIYQVDEFQNLYMAKVLAAGQSAQFFTTFSLFLFGPLSWISQMHVRADQMFALARLVFLGVFWLNLILMAWSASGRLFSTRGMIALLAAATLAPLWDYGFEIRHDNLVVAGVLLIWWAMRVKPMGLISYALAGAVTVAFLFIAVKSVVYIVPLSGAVWLFPPPSIKRPRWQLALALIVGAMLGVVLVRLCYGSSGAWDDYLKMFRGVSKYSAGAGGTRGKFPPWETLARLLTQTPPLLALALAGLFAVLADLLRRRIAALTWNSILPEALLMLGSLGALMINPNPFPYNLVHVVPYAFIFAFRYGAEVANELRLRSNLSPIAGTVLLFVQLISFAGVTLRHLDFSNSRQEKLMRLTEDLTDPAKDTVYDAVGMVPTRPSINYHWYLHSLNTRIMNQPGNRVREMLAAKPAAVLMRSYRTDWLPAADHEFIREHYVPLADDFLVLGVTLPPGGGEFQITHPGRYCIVSWKPPDGFASEDANPILFPGKISGALDGVPLTNDVAQFEPGVHHVETSTNFQPAVVWLGPTLDALPRLPNRDHRLLFVNWY